MDSGDFLQRYFGMPPGGRIAVALRHSLETAVAMVGGDEGSLLAYDEDANDLCFVATVGNPDSERALLGQRVPLGQGITGLAAESGEVQVGAPNYKDITQTERLGAGPEAVVAAPILAGDDLYGVVTSVSFAAGRRFGAREAELYARFAGIFAALLEAQRLSVPRSGAAPVAFGAARGRETALAERLGDLARGDPASLEALERMLDAFERLVARGRG